MIFHKIMYFVADNSIKRVKHLKSSQNFHGKTQNLGMALKNLSLPIQLITFLDFWVNVLRIAHPVNISYLPPW